MSNMITDIGNARSLNEDFVLIDENDRYKLYIVCDGIGGHNAGEIASEETSMLIKNYIREFYEQPIAENILKSAILKANEEVYRLSNDTKAYEGMGTTITCALVEGNQCIFGHIGDSAAFIIKNNSIYKITKDHSLVQELVDRGTITEDEMASHPNKNIITRSLGSKSDVEVDIFIIETKNYDKCIICTDGLADYVKMEEILEIVLEENNEERALEKMVSLAKKRGGRDNISALIFGGEN